MLDVLDIWEGEILPRVAEFSIPTSAVLSYARPLELGGNRLLLLFPPGAAFYCNLASEPLNVAVLHEALFDLTGRKPGLLFRVGDPNVDTRQGRSDA